jgi:hypothetical protein
MSHLDQAHARMVRKVTRHRPWSTRLHLLPPAGLDTRGSKLDQDWVMGAWMSGFVLFFVFLMGVPCFFPHLSALFHAPAVSLTREENKLMGSFFLACLGAATLLPWATLRLIRRRRRQAPLGPSWVARLNVIATRHPTLVPVVTGWAQGTPLAVGDVEFLNGLLRTLTRAAEKDQAQLERQACRAAREKAEADRKAKAEACFQEGPIGVEMERCRLGHSVNHGATPDPRRL